MATSAKRPPLGPHCEIDTIVAADWRGEQMAHRDTWRLRLTDPERAEILAAIDEPATFPLPTLGARLERLRDDVTTGHGLALVQGLPLAGLTEAQCETVALGVAKYVGVVVPQGPTGVPLLHVRDDGADPDRATTRSYQHARRLGFHADPTDIVALLCVRPAASGGMSAIVSAVAVHNEIVRTRPDLAAVLYEPWWFDRRTGDGSDSFFQQPVYETDADGGLVSHYGPDYMRSALRGAHVPPLTRARVEAMETLDRLTNDPRFALTMDLRPGDMQFLNNHVILHGRTAYADDPDPARRRDLIRLWLDRTASRVR